MPTDQELAEGGYRFEDLLALRIVSGRTDLERKQKQHGFPKPVKTGARQTWFPKTEVHAWLRMRMALRDKQAVKAGDPLPGAVRMSVKSGQGERGGDGRDLSDNQT
jgi:predicted DNA-binding transcriptional regulator AlpA